ncbi:MAG: response regulator transcription factor [Gammaproteobacteria bacterium]|nr:response regulator transcription factor [Gammaproteobacteria bacterium]
MKILVADDHGLVREGIKLTLGKLSREVEIIEATSGDEVLQQMQQNRDVDLLVLDLFMPQTDGFALLALLCKNFPDLLVVILSASEDVHHVRKAIDWGASGYIPKSASEGEMLAALEEVLQGGIYVPTQTYSSGVVTISHGAAKHDLHFTGRQKQVLGLLGEGRTNKEIANSLGLSEYTIKIHVTAILKLLGATNRTQAVIEAKRLGLLPISV